MKPTSNKSRKTERQEKSTSSSSNKTVRRVKVVNPRRLIFIASFVLIATGYILMSGPGSTEEHFEPDIFSTTRIVIAPLLCLVGYLLIIVGILWKDKTLDIRHKNR